MIIVPVVFITIGIFCLTSKVWQRLPGAHHRLEVYGCSYGNHFDSGRVGACPAPSCWAFCGSCFYRYWSLSVSVICSKPITLFCATIPSLVTCAFCLNLFDLNCVNISLRATTRPCHFPGRNALWSMPGQRANLTSGPLAPK